MIAGSGIAALVRRSAPAIGLAGLALLVLAGRPLARQALTFWPAAAVLYGVLFWLLLGRHADESETLDPVEPASGPPRLLPLAIALPLALVAWKYSAGNRFQTPGVIGWIGSVAVWLWAWWPGKTPRVTGSAPPVRPESRITVGVAATLVAILALGVFLYFHELARTPSEPHSDHAETLIDVTSILRGERPIFFPRNTGREPWKFYWITFLVKVLGMPVTYFTMKVATALIGLLAIPAMFLLGRELGGNRLGLFAGALVSWSKWPLAQSRVGNRFAYAIFPTALVLWALLRYLRRGDRASALWAGLWIGIGLYGYIPSRVVPLLVPLVAALALLDPRWRGRRRRLFMDIPLTVVTAFLVFLPLLHFAREYPAFFWQRMAERSSLSHALGRDTLATMAHNLGNMALAFNVRGDGGWVNFVRGDPFLDIVTGALFLAGVALALSRVFRGSVRWLVPLAGLLVLTLPSVLILTFAHENPSVNRAVAAVPAVFLLAAAPLDQVVRWLKPLPSAARVAGYAALALLLALSIRESYRTYFRDYHRQYALMVEHVVEMANEIRAWEGRGIPRSNAYVLNAQYWLDPRTIAFELGDPRWAATQEIPSVRPPPLLAKRPLLFLCRPSDPRREALRGLYPRGEERLIAQEYADRNFYVYIVR